MQERALVDIGVLFSRACFSGNETKCGPELYLIRHQYQLESHTTAHLSTLPLQGTVMWASSDDQRKLTLEKSF